ncbi:MAG: hypothetical protein U0324_00650 [Polyangiales bacterium]
MRPLVVFVALTGCGLLGGPAAPPATTPATAPTNGATPAPGPTPTPAPAPADDEVRALVTQALTPQMCPRMLGSFIGLPGEGSATGPAAGALPSAGRWWIRSCDARTQGDRVVLSIGGPGWTWIDRETSGFRVRQYLLFEAQAELGADVAVGYDRASRVATLWMRPAEGVRATITPRGVVSAEATGFFSTILGGVAAVTGNSVSDRARQQAGELGSTMLRDRLAVGFTMTLALERNQVDFMVGSLQRGETPERPYPPTAGAPWVVNQRSTVWPGGLDVVGPVDPRNGRLGLDVALEEGDGATVRATCADALNRYFDARFRTPDVAPPAPPAGVTVAELSAGAAPQHLTLPDNVPGGPCPLLLTIAPRGANLPARLRYRVAPEAPGAAVAPTTRRVRIQLAGATVAHANPDGRAWDLVGGEADLTVVTASIPLGRAIDTAPVVADRDSATWDRWLPGSYDVSRDLPLRFSVFDDDATTRELIGVADLDAARVPSATGEFTLPLRSEGAVPRQTGTLRLRAEVLP